MTGYRDGYDVRKWQASGQRPRRSWVRWALAGSTIAALVAPWISGASNHPPIFLAALPVFFVSWLPFARESWATERGRAIYDEFEYAALLRATARAFAAYIGLVTLLIGWMAVAPDLGWPVPTQRMHWIGWLTALLAIGTTLPATFAEFMVPMPDMEDEML